MAGQNYTAIVLRYANYKDYDRMLTLFTRERGVISASSRGCRKPKSPLLGGSEVFAYGEYLLFERAGRYVVDSCEVMESFYPVREDISRFAGGMSMLKLVEKSGAAERSEELFSMLYYALSFLCYADMHPADITVCFMLRALSILGMQPSLTRCAACGRDIRAEKILGFSPEQGGALCPDCMSGAQSITALALEAMRRMLLLDDESMKKVRLPEALRGELKKTIKTLVSYLMEYDFKSLDQI